MSRTEKKKNIESSYNRNYDAAILKASGMFLFIPCHDHIFGERRHLLISVWSFCAPACMSAVCKFSLSLPYFILFCFLRRFSRYNQQLIKFHSIFRDISSSVSSIMKLSYYRVVRITVERQSKMADVYIKDSRCGGHVCLWSLIWTSAILDFFL